MRKVAYNTSAYRNIVISVYLTHTMCGWAALLKYDHLTQVP